MQKEDKSDNVVDEKDAANAAAVNGEAAKAMPNTCDCGAQPKFFQIQTGKHVCEQCILGEIYADESYEDVYLKVLNKMQNIMRLRMK